LAGTNPRVHFENQRPAPYNRREQEGGYIKPTTKYSRDDNDVSSKSKYFTEDMRGANQRGPRMSREEPAHMK
jgi:hypothetical protein